MHDVPVVVYGAETIETGHQAGRRVLAVCVLGVVLGGHNPPVMQVINLGHWALGHGLCMRCM